MKLLATWPMNIKHASQRALEKNPMPKSYCTNEIWRSSQVKSTRLPSQTGSLLNARHVDSDFPFFSFRADHQSTLVAHLNVQPIPSSTKHIGSPPCAVEVAPLRHLRLICCFAVELDNPTCVHQSRASGAVSSISLCISNQGMVVHAWWRRRRRRASRGHGEGQLVGYTDRLVCGTALPAIPRDGRRHAARLTLSARWGINDWAVRYPFHYVDLTWEHRFLSQVFRVASGKLPWLPT